MIKHCRPTITVHITVNIASSRQGQAVISSQNTMSKFLTEVPPHGQKYLPKLAVPVQRSSCFDSNHYYFLHNKIIGTNVASHVVSSEPAFSSKNLFAGVASACGWCLCTNRKKKKKRKLSSALESQHHFSCQPKLSVPLTFIIIYKQCLPAKQTCHHINLFSKGQCKL